MNKLTEDDIHHAIEAYKSYATFSSRIADRMDYIIRFCVEKVKGKFSWWDWSNGGDSGDRAPGDFMHSYSKHTPDTLQIIGSWTNGHKMVFLDNKGNEWELQYGEIPTRWLYENFEEEYENGLRLYEEAEAKKADKTNQSKAVKKKEREALIASAKSKLTPEERKALKVK